MARRGRGGRVTAGKRRQGASVDQQVHSLQMSAAEADFAVRQAAHEQLMAAAEADFAEQLADPVQAARLGLPPVLPRFTIDVLKRTMAMDKYQHLQPNKAEVYARHGVAGDPFATAAAEMAKRATRRGIGVLGPDEFVPFSFDDQEDR